MTMSDKTPTPETIVAAYESGKSLIDVSQDLGITVYRTWRTLDDKGVARRSKNLARKARIATYHKGDKRTYLRVKLDSGHRMFVMTNVNGYVLEHRLVMAEYLDRPLTKSETVHHIDGDTTNNKIENLQLRIGPHGRGQVLKCNACGSHNVQAVEL